MKKVIVITASIIVCLASALAVLVAVIGADALDPDANRLVFESGSANATYSGEALTSSEWKLAEGSLKNGHTATVTATGSQTDAGESKNTLSISVKNKAGDDVTAQYTIKVNEGTLSVAKRKIAVTAKSAQKIYDGAPLVCEGYDIIEGELVSGHTATARYSGEQVDVGSTECKAELQILDAQGNDKTSNYEIICNSGTLTVVKRHLSLVSPTTEKIYDGTPLINRKIRVLEGELVSEHSLNVDASARITNAGEVSNSFTATVSDVYGNDVTDNYELVCNFGKLRVLPSPITVYTHSATKVYDGAPLICDTFSITSGVVASGESILADFSESATNVGFYENKATFSVINVAGVDTTKNYSFTVITGTLTVQGRKLVISSLSDTKTFDGTPLVKHEYEIVDGTELVAGHTVNATYRGEQTLVGTSKNEFEVLIFDADGQDVSSNYEIKTIFGNLSVTTAGLSIQSPNTTKTYDGQKLQSAVDDLTYSRELVEGHRYVIDITGEQTDVGESENTFTVLILDENDNDVTYCYNIATVFGKLTVIPRQITVESADIYKVYDGTPLRSNSSDVVLIDGTIAEGQMYIVEILEERTEVGISENKFTFRVFDENGEDVSTNYDIEYIFGDITVYSRKLIISSMSDTKTFDGTPLVKHEYELLDGEIVPWHSISVIFRGEQLYVGTSKNEFEVVIRDSDGEDVTSNYEIEAMFGDLTVNKARVFIQSPDVSKEYDGQKLQSSVNDLMISGELAVGHSFDIEITGEQTVVGESANTFRVTVLDEYGEDITFCYDIGTDFGYLTVTKRRIGVQSENISKVYDGTPLKGEDSSVSVVYGSIADGQDAVVQFLEERTNVGTTENKFILSVFDENGEDVSSNYDIEYRYGDITVTRRRLIISSLSDTKTFDGTPLVKHEYTLLGGTDVADGQRIDAVFSGAQTYVGKSQNLFDTVILDANGEDVTSNYNIRSTAGTLTVTPAEITVYSPNEMKIYDGQKLQSAADEHGIIGELAQGHRCVINVTGEQTNVGESDNSFTVSILDSDNKDVSYCYNVTPIYGKLTVTPKSITVISRDVVETYDGTPKKGQMSDIELSVPLVDGHSLEVIFLEEIIAVGTVENSFTCRIFDADGNEMTPNYDISTVFGKVTVTKRHLVITSPSINEVYDATEKFSKPDDCLIDGTVADGETLTIILPERHTDVYEGVNTINVMIERNGENVISNYDIVLNEREFVIYPQIISIQSGSAEKVYDGTPLICDSYKLLYPEELPAGDRLVVVITGQRLSVGESLNTFTVDIVNAQGKSVLFNYTVDKTEGALVVTEKSNPGDNNGGDDGSNNGNIDTSGDLGGGGQGPEVTVMQLKSDVSGPIYMRLMSYGNFTGRGWNEASVRYTQMLNGRYSYNYLTGNAISNSGMSAVNIQIKNNASQYFLPYYLAEGEGDYALPDNDVMFTNAHDGEYSLTYYPYTGDGSNLPPTTYSAEEQAYRKIVYENYCDVDDETEEYLLGIIQKQGFSKDDSDIINKIAVYIRSSAKYNLEYDEDLDYESNAVISFLRDYKEGVCRHYASAATLMFRTLGIPARYTIGYSGATKAGEWVDITTKTAHAWVEVYLDGIGWIAVEVTPSQPGDGGGGGGGNDDPSKALTLTPVKEYMRYDGINTLRHSGKLKGLTDLEKAGYTYDVEIEGERKEVGITYAVIKKFVLYDPDMNDVTDEFDITFKSGALHVYEREITVLSGSAQKAYDGTALTSSYYTVSGEDDAPTHVIKVVCNGSRTNVGTSSNTFYVEIWDYADPDNPKNVTNNYKINKKEGRLEVTPRLLYVEAGSASKVYDGDPLTCNIHYSTGLIEGHTTRATIVGSLTKIGECSNIITYVEVYDANGKIVTDNYSIQYISGMLSVNPPD